MGEPVTCVTRFGWLKTIALLRKVRHRGVCKVDWIFTFACAAYRWQGI